MKQINTAAGLALAAYFVVALAACSKTDNGSNNSSPAAAAATQCIVSGDGQYRDQTGRTCSPNGLTGYGCNGYIYNGQTGTYTNPANGQVVPAATCGGTNVIPNTGYYGNNYIGGQGGSGCQQWSQYYGITYVPVDIGGGSLVCVNYQYLQSQITASYPQYEYSQYAQPNYWYSNPPVAYETGYGYGAGGGYSSCATNINLGFSTGSFGAGINLCF